MKKKHHTTDSNKAGRLPGEFEKHAATILGWPHNKEDWPQKFEPIPWVYTEIVKKLVPYEKVVILYNSEKQLSDIENKLTMAEVGGKNRIYVNAKTDRGWMRDSMPAFVKKGTAVHGVDFAFNAWAKYDNYKNDGRSSRILLEALEIPFEVPYHNGKPVVLEGGAIDSNGRGTMLTTEECLLDPKVQVRNPGFTAKDYEEVFAQHLGITNVIWLGKGIAGDDTHGHVDDLARFVNETTIVLCEEKRKNDKNYKILNENRERLQSALLENGERPEVVALPMPEPLSFDGMRLPASYANFYIANGTVLVPVFNDPNDKDALGILSELFPKRKVTGIGAVDLIWGLGTLHCLTHEVPAGGTGTLVNYRKA
ncbi:MAG: agmatine deiminase family protein [Ignavibacteriales bacterium]|nr:agmatine deiminase family protein [Ignavibacteriales bacterium]